jgi:hypothetical protein
METSTMKLRRITIEVEVPWFSQSEDVLVRLTDALNEELGTLHQEQVVDDAESPNVRLGVYE